VKVKYCNKKLLAAINRRAIDNNYNRTVQEAYIATLPEDINFPVTFCMPHEHAAGKPVDQHMRCRIMTGKSLTGPFSDVWVDVEMGMFMLLPEAEVTEQPAKKRKFDEFSNN
jgi:hypothetical protein